MASDMTHAVAASSDIVHLYESYLQMFWTESAVSQIMAEFLVPTLIDDDRVQATEHHGPIAARTLPSFSPARLG
jgi:hypothetical protein